MKSISLILVGLVLVGCAARALHQVKPAEVAEGDWTMCLDEMAWAMAAPPQVAQSTHADVSYLSMPGEMAVGIAGAAVVGVLIAGIGHALWGDWTQDTADILATRGCLRAKGYPIAPDGDLPPCSLATPPPCRS